MSNIGSSKIARMHVGSTKITEAYVGSTLVFKLPSSSYDSYRVRVYWTSGGAHPYNFAGLKINDVQATFAQVTSIRYLDSSETWYTLPSSHLETAITWESSGVMFGAREFEIAFTSSDDVSKVAFHEGNISHSTLTWLGTIEMYGASGSTETLLYSNSVHFSGNTSGKTYIINLQ